ncbi:MAG: hypothetical protein VX589_10400 [Myxococcota bacterium]|nr:hypothetical protein [Myxococcota bacterium]
MSGSKGLKSENTPPQTRSPHPWQQYGLLIALLGVLVGFVVLCNAFYPVTDWLFFKYLKVWAYLCFWALGVCGLGWTALRWMAPRLSVGERFVLGSALGVYGVFLTIFLGGLLGILGPAFALLMPAVCMLVGWTQIRGFLADSKAWHWLRTPRVEFGGIGWIVMLFGLLAVGVLYFGLLSPKNISFDTHMYHLGLAEEWAHLGGIYRSNEGWFVETLPQLSAVLYTWPLLVPGLDYFEHIALAAHTEFILFVWTLFGIPIVVRWMVPGQQSTLSWVAMLTFPSLYIYDAGLMTGSDHVAAFFALPILVSLRLSWNLDPKKCALLAIMLGAAVLTKYQAVSLALAPVLMILGRAGLLALRQVRGEPSERAWGIPLWLVGPAVAFIVGLLATSPHWLKNWIWYGDPLYPALHSYLDLKPWSTDATRMMAWNWKRMVIRPTGTFTEQLGETASQFFRIGFKDFARGRFHGKWPMFGTLFSLTIIWLPFLRKSRRTWIVLLMTHLGVFCWYFFSHIERYLQALVPWMAAVVAASVLLAWHRGGWARILVGAVVCLQVVWGASAPFYPTHAMNRKSPIATSAELMHSGFSGQVAKRDQVAKRFQRISEQLPENAVVLLHEYNPRVGLKRRIVSDMPGNQGRIFYGSMKNAQEILTTLRSLGITHVVWRDGRARARDTLAGDIRFHAFMKQHGVSKRRFGSWSSARLPKKVAAARHKTQRVAYLGCSRRIKKALYRLDALNVHSTRPKNGRKIPKKSGKKQKALLEKADFIVFGKSCKTGYKKAVLRGFKRLAQRGKDEIYMRTTPKKKRPKRGKTKRKRKAKSAANFLKKSAILGPRSDVARRAQSDESSTSRTPSSSSLQQSAPGQNSAPVRKTVTKKPR